MTKSPHGRAVERMAAEIGYICIHWAWLEDVVDFLIALLAPIENHEIANAITGNVDIRQKAQMLRALAFLKKGANDDWYEYAIKTINTVDNDLRARRNFFVHSSLYSTDGRLMRQRKIIKLMKPQAFQPTELKTMEITPAKIREARKLQKDIYSHVKKVALIYAFALHPDIFAQRRISFRQFLHRTESSGRRKRIPRALKPRQRLPPG